MATSARRRREYGFNTVGYPRFQKPRAVPRKLWHMSGVLIVVLYAGFDLDRSLVVWSLWGLALGHLAVDFLRWQVSAVRALVQRLFRPLIEPKDESGLNGNTIYFLGCAVAVAFFPRAEACVGVLALCLGDPSAALVGTAVRSPRLFGKNSLAGSLACFGAVACAARYFLPWPTALAAAATATLLEAVSGSKLDNFTIPVGTAAAVAWLTGAGLA